MQYLAMSRRESHEVELSIPSDNVENTENSAIRLEYNLEPVMRDDKRLEDHKENVTSVEKVQAELLKLKTKLMEITDSMSDQNSVHSPKMVQQKELLEKERQSIAQKLSGSAVEFEMKQAEEVDEIRYKFKTTVETLHEQLSASEKIADDFKEILVDRIREQKFLSSNLDMYTRKTQYKDQITAFKVSIDKLENDAAKHKQEMSQMKFTYERKILKLSAELNNGVDLSDVATLQSPNRRLSTSSEITSHGDIISKMQSQLEKLHKVLDAKASSVVHEDLEVCLLNLINEILANVSTLNSELEKIKSTGSIEYISYKQACSKKDEELHNLRAEIKKHREAMQNKTEYVSSAFTGGIDTLQGRLNETLNTWERKIDEASKKIVILIASLRDNDLQHANAAKSLLFDLHQSQHDINTLKKEINKSHSELLIYHAKVDKLNKSQDLLTKLKMVTDDEVNELKSELELAHQRGDMALAASVSSQNIKVDADSGQVIAEQEDTQIKDSLLLKKEEIISSLRAELESLKCTERHARSLEKEANKKLLENEREILEIKEETKMLQSQVEKIESKLQIEVSKH